MNIQKRIIFWLLFSLTIAYLTWELYWYLNVGLACIKWHSHLFLFSGPILWIVLYYDIYKKKPNARISFLLLVLFTLFCWETILTISGSVKTAEEKNLGYLYVPQRISSNKEQYYHIDKPNTKKVVRKNEFTFRRNMNSLGYADSEIQKRKSAKEIRILCLGDSFTEGDGADFNHSYVAQLRSKLNKKKGDFYVFNAGKCGSDPFFNYLNYKDLLIKYDFDIVLQTLSTSDIQDDIASRGGFERFKKKYVVSFGRVNPIIEHIYVMSYVGRVVLKQAGYNQLIINSSNLQEDVRKTENLMHKFALLTKKNETKLILVVLPNKVEVLENYPEYFQSLIGRIKKKNTIAVIDLRQLYRQELKEQPSNFIDNHWWKEDWHHNSKGYEMMANSVFVELVKGGFLTK